MYKGGEGANQLGARWARMSVIFARTGPRVGPNGGDVCAPAKTDDPAGMVATKTRVAK